MKQIICIFTIIIFAIATASAQEVTSIRVLPVGSSVIDGSLGLSSYPDIVIPPISVSYERILLDYGQRMSFGVGCNTGLHAQRSYSGKTLGGCILITGLGHCAVTGKIDAFFGPYIGYIRVSSGSYALGTPCYGVMLGARYFFNDSMGANIYLGGLGVVNLGVSCKF